MAADRFLSRFFEFLIRAARAQVAQMDIDSRTMARSPFPVSQRWLALLMVLAMRFLSIFVPACLFAFVHRRVTKDDISGETYHGYPRPFRRIKSRISKRGDKKTPVAVNFMQILAFREFVSFHHLGEIPGIAHNPGIHAAHPPAFYEILYTRCPFSVIYSRSETPLTW